MYDLTCIKKKSQHSGASYFQSLSHDAIMYLLSRQLELQSFRYRGHTCQLKSIFNYTKIFQSCGFMAIMNVMHKHKKNIKIQNVNN